MKSRLRLFVALDRRHPCTPRGHAAKRTRWLKYLPARAFDNSVYVAACNQVGSSGPTEYPGNSIVLNPVGEVLAEAKPMVEDLLVVDLTAAGLLAKRGEPLQFFTSSAAPTSAGTWCGRAGQSSSEV